MSVLANALAATLALAAAADTGKGWQLQPADGSHGEVLTFKADGEISYRFECTANAVVVTQVGNTTLTERRNGRAIDDGPDAGMADGAATMAIFGGKGDLRFQPAEAVKNPAGGWDITIRLPKDDKQLKAIAKSERLSLFSTGYAIEVVMSSGARAKWTDFMKRCQAVG